MFHELIRSDTTRRAWYILVELSFKELKSGYMPENRSVYEVTTIGRMS